MYILLCADGSYYTGSTKDLERRLAQHQRGEGANHTRKNLPVELVYFEEFDRIDQAFYREKQVQGWSRKKKEALIQGNTIELKKLAECRNESHFRNAPFGSAQGANTSSAQGANTSSAQGAGKKEKILPVVERSQEVTPGSKGKTYPVVERSRNDRNQKVKKDG